MIPSPPKPRFEPGTRVRVFQRVRVGSQAWRTQVDGCVVSESLAPIGGMEMGPKDRFCRQPTLVLRRDDGEITVVNCDEFTQVDTLPPTSLRSPQ